jgi:hypothetical protein
MLAMFREVVSAADHFVKLSAADHFVKLCLLLITL